MFPACLRSAALALLAGSLLLPTAAAGETPVEPELRLVPKDYPTIQAAVNAALPGDEIRISKGVYKESVTLTGKSGLLIRGKGAIVNPGGGALAFTLNGCSDIVIEGLHFRNTEAWPLIDCLGGSNLTFRRLRFSKGNYAIFAGGVNGLILERIVAQDLSGGVLLFENSSNMLVSRVRVLRCYEVVGGSSGSDLRIERVSASKVEDRGINLGSFEPVNDVTIERVRLSKLGDDAVEIEGDRVRVDRLRVVRGDGEGLSIRGDDAVVTQAVFVNVIDHHALSVSGADMRVSGVRIVKPEWGAEFQGAGAEIRDVKVVRPERVGLEFDNFSNGLAENCLVVRPGREGVEVDGGEDSVFRNIRVLGAVKHASSGGPVLALHDGDPAFDLEGTRHLFENCLSKGSAASAFVVDGVELVFVENTAIGAREHGFEVQSGGNLFQRNKAVGSKLFDLFDEQFEGGNTYEDNDFKTILFGAGS